MKVLIVDDSAIVRERLKGMLSEVPKVETISQAEGSGEALESLHRLKPDIVVLDIQMSGGNGIGALREMKNGNQSPLVIVLTNQSYLQYRRACLDAGADFFLDKSSEFDRVTEVLNHLA